jgi:hypothetical protein
MLPGPGRRWRDEATILRAYLSHDGALMLADPMLGGNAACEPATTVTWQTRKPTTSQDQTPSEGSQPLPSSAVR